MKARFRSGGKRETLGGAPELFRHSVCKFDRHAVSPILHSAGGRAGDGSRRRPGAPGAPA